MDKHLFLELIGYAASGLIAVSLMMNSIVRLRILNMAGAATFAIYGLLIHAYPVTVLNSITVSVNAYHLIRMMRAKEYFQILKLRPDSDYLRYFLNFYRNEIARILPDFQYRPVPNQVTLFVLRNCAPAAVLIAELKPDGVLRVVLDFAIPRFRDLKIGRFLFVEQAGFFRERGVKEIVISPRTKAFGTYLVKVGFKPAGAQEGSFHIRYANDAK